MVRLCGGGTSRRQSPGAGSAPQLIAAAAEPFEDIEGADLAALLERVSPARVVLIGEASHGTSEFYRMRQRITRELLEHNGFAFVAAEADWPDAAAVDAYVRRAPDAPDRARQIFGRFPTWMWRNREVLAFVEWLRRHNEAQAAQGRAAVGFFGLDLYSLYDSIGEVLRYLDEVDPEAAAVARQRYECLKVVMSP